MALVLSTPNMIIKTLIITLVLFNLGKKIPLCNDFATFIVMNCSQNDDGKKIAPYF
jgi:hypothetical protein